MALNTPGRDLLEHATWFLEDEDISLARARIQQAIALEPENKDVVPPAIGQLLYLELYSSARRAAENYVARTGLSIFPGFGCEDIVQMEKDNRVVDDVPVFDLAAGPIQFKRLSDEELDLAPTYIRNYKPVEFIEATEQGLNITQSGIKHAVKWKEFTRASIVHRLAVRDPGVSKRPAAQKICTLEAPGKRFQFDVSAIYSDFKGALLLRTILDRYLDVERIDAWKPNFKAAKDYPIRNLERGGLIQATLKLALAIAFLIAIAIYTRPN